MCGIFGAIGEYDPGKIAILSLLNEDRGRDSFGLYDTKTLFKTIRLPKSCLDHKLLNVRESLVIIGHTRKSTVGYNTESNAHPFQYGSITGVHNGGIANWRNIEEYSGEHFTVDSQAAIWGLDKEGINFTKKLEGVWALAWTDDKRPNTLFLTCSGKPLATGYAKDKKAIYFSSEGRDLWRIGCEDIKEVENRCYYEIPADTLIKSMRIIAEEKELVIGKKPEEKKIDVKTVSSIVNEVEKNSWLVRSQVETEKRNLQTMLQLHGGGAACGVNLDKEKGDKKPEDMI